MFKCSAKAHTKPVHPAFPSLCIDYAALIHFGKIITYIIDKAQKENTIKLASIRIFLKPRSF